MASKRAIGIDLGTTNSVIAYLEGGKPEVIANVEGGRTTPSVVAWTKDGQRLVGQVARRQAAVNPENTVYSAKRFIGRGYGEVTGEIKNVPYKVTKGHDGAVRFSVGGKQVAPEEVSAQVLAKLADDASKFLGEKVTDVVITVPAYFNDAQRQATKDAGRVAGLNVLRIINEPTAAALAYGMNKKKEETVMVFDLGGGTFDVSILEVGEGVCEVRATSGDTHLGGDDFDKVVLDWIADEFKREHGVDLREDRQSLQRLMEAAEKAKCELSTLHKTTINVPYITANASGPKHLLMDLTRAKFDELTAHLVQRCVAPVERALADAKLEVADLDEVILVGGSTRTPAVQNLVRRLTGGKEPCMSVNPDEVVACGAAVQAGIIGGEVQDVVLLDVTPLSLGVETLGGVMTKIVERNTTIPCSKVEVFSTAEDSQPAVDIVVLQGEREMAADNRRLGQFKLDGVRPAPRGVPQIEVTFDLDQNGILKVTAKDRDTGKEQRITVTGSTNLDKGEIERMVHDAEACAADDKRRRDEVDARNEAESLAYQVERTLKDLGASVPEHERARAQDLVEKTRKALKEGAPVNELRRLRSDLEQVVHGIAASAYGSTTGRPGTTGPSAGKPGGEDDVVDAEFTSH